MIAKGDFWSQGFWTWVILSPEIKILSLKNKNYVFLTSIQCFQLTAWSRIDHLLRDSSICWRGEASEVWRVTFLGWGHANYKLYGWVSKSVLIHNPVFYKPHSIGTHDQNNMHSYCLVTEANWPCYTQAWPRAGNTLSTRNGKWLLGGREAYPLPRGTYCIGTHSAWHMLGIQ